MNWIQKLSIFNYTLDGRIPCRIKSRLDHGRILVETQNGGVFEIFESEFMKRTKNKIKPKFPNDLLCNNCGNLSDNNYCNNCGREIV